jgi:hypothetical protein
MRKHLLLFPVPAGLVALAIGGWLPSPRTAATPENAERIKKGMTLAEVDAILGPARNKATGDHCRDASIGDDGAAIGWPEPLMSMRQRGIQWRPTASRFAWSSRKGAYGIVSPGRLCESFPRGQRRAS